MRFRWRWLILGILIVAIAGIAFFLGGPLIHEATTYQRFMSCEIGGAFQRGYWTMSRKTRKQHGAERYWNIDTGYITHESWWVDGTCVRSRNWDLDGSLLGAPKEETEEWLWRADADEPLPWWWRAMDASAPSMPHWMKDEQAWHEALSGQFQRK